MKMWQQTLSSSQFFTHSSSLVSVAFAHLLVIHIPCLTFFSCPFIFTLLPLLLPFSTYPHLFITFFKKINLFIYFWGRVGSSLLCTGFIQLRRAGDTLRCCARASHCGGFSCCEARALGMWASVVVAHRLSSCGLCRLQSAGSVVVAHGLSCSAARGIFPDQGLNPCPLHWQVGS